MNNRRNLKENLTISNKQRFSIRKFSIGVASVMLGTTLYFMGGVGTSIVHADSVQGQRFKLPIQTQILHKHQVIHHQQNKLQVKIKLHLHKIVKKL